MGFNTTMSTASGTMTATMNLVIIPFPTTSTTDIFLLVICYSLNLSWITRHAPCTWSLCLSFFTILPLPCSGNAATSSDTNGITPYDCTDGTGALAMGDPRRYHDCQLATRKCAVGDVALEPRHTTPTPTRVFVAILAQACTGWVMIT